MFAVPRSCKVCSVLCHSGVVDLGGSFCRFLVSTPERQQCGRCSRLVLAAALWLWVCLRLFVNSDMLLLFCSLVVGGMGEWPCVGRVLAVWERPVFSVWAPPGAGGEPTCT